MKSLNNEVKLINLPQLPENYASKLLDIEIELETDFTLENLNALVQFYSQIIEYFEHIKDPKFYDFQERMHKTLMRPEIHNLMNDENKRRKAQANPPQKVHVHEEIHSAPVSPRHRSQTEIGPEIMFIRKQEAKKKTEVLSGVLNRRMTVVNNKVTRNLNRIVENNDERVKKVTKKALGDVKSMDRNLEQRLAHRKKKNLNSSLNSSQMIFTPRSQSTIFDFDLSDLDETVNNLISPRNLESDRSGGFPKYQMPDIEEIEERVMGVMERSYGEKSRLVTDIKVKYESQIQELEGQGPFFGKIIDQMRKTMEEEIKKVTQEIDLKRKEEIRIIKEQC